MVLRQVYSEQSRVAQDRLFLEKGLVSSEAQKRLEKFGSNELKKKKEFSGLKVLLSQFRSPLIYILVFAGLVTLALRDFTDTIVIFAAVVLNTALGFYQEFKAQKSLMALRSLLAPKAKVIRDGKQKIIDARLLIPGDLVVLTIGDRVPADGVLAEATDLTVNEAILTGESMPVKKAVQNTSEVRLRLRHTSEVKMGTTVVTGIGKMIVTKTGMETEIGKIGKAVEEIEEEKTPLQVQLGKLAKILAIVVGIMTVLIFIIGELRGHEPLEMFTTSVAVAVAAIPEGLVVSLTVILALGMQRILRRKAIVRRLLAAETLGSVSVICADKTGTLTEGKLRVVDSVTNDQRPTTKDLLIKAAVLCNDMRDPLEEAMMRWAEGKFKVKSEKLKVEYPRLDEIPFSPITKIIATLHPGLLLISGAPEVVLRKCKMQNAKCRMWEKRFEEYGRRGYRLVGFAYKEIHPRGVSPRLARGLSTSGVKIGDLEWLGILIYEDPIREGVKEVLEECQQAGIKVKVITGDYLPTALAVLEKLKVKSEKLKVNEFMTGEELEKISPQELRSRVGEILLFARTDPQQKLKIVKALKENGEVVAMMGDGVNDAPALKQSDIGIVVSEVSDVAKETADIVLLDSNFATIVYAIEEGRNIFENIKKVTLYLLSCSFTEIILIGGCLLLKLPLPITAAQILWINLIQDSLPAVALAFEPKEKELMKESPRERGATIFDTQMKALVFVIGILTDFFLLGLVIGTFRGLLPFSFNQTMIFISLGIISSFIVFACRSLRKPIFKYNPFANKFLTGSVLVSFGLLLVAIYLPILQILLGTHPLGVIEWAFLLALGLVDLLAIEGTKWVFIRKRENII